MSAIRARATPPYQRYTRRAVSEMPDPTSSQQQQHRWSLLSAWTSFRRSYAPRHDGSSKRGRRKLSEGSSEGDNDSTGGGSGKKKGNRESVRYMGYGAFGKDGVGEMLGKKGGKRVPRKRVSLLLRRRGKSMFRCGDEMGKGKGKGKKNGEEEEEEIEKMMTFKRALSLHDVPIGVDRDDGGAGNCMDGEGKEVKGSTVEIKAKVGEETFEKLHNFARTASMYSTGGEGDGGGKDSAIDDGDENCDDEIVGEIRLEDYADNDSDYDFMDTQSVLSKMDSSHYDVGTFKMGNTSGGESQRLTWIGNEKELQAFFAEAGIIDDFEIEEVKEVNLEEFNVSDEQQAEWEAVSKEHNDRFADAGAHAGSSETGRDLDIRSLADEFVRMHSRTQSAEE